MADVDEMRAAFFRKTRRMVAVLYACFGIAAAGLLAAALAMSVRDGALGFAVGFVAAVVLFAVSPLMPVSAGAARHLVFLAPVVGISAIGVFDLGDLMSDAFFAGAFGGFLAGTVAGIAAIRRRLAHDDELLLRQKRLGFDPERPHGWLRG